MPEPTPAASAPYLAADHYPIVVLLVDDQPMVAELVRRALAGQPNLVLHYCGEGVQALASAERLHPTVILQDLLLPDADGLDLVQQYQANPRTRDVPVIVLSTAEDPAVKSEAFRRGAADYLVKLPDPIELVARIRHHSKAYLNQIQRDQAFRALHDSQQQLIAVNIELQRLTNIDGLTGLSNRRYLDAYLAGEWKRAQRTQSCLSAAMIDVDEFKRYNDTYGHLAGDEVLKTVAATIRRGVARPADMAARFGGEEFIVILPDTAQAGALWVAEELRAALEGQALEHSSASTSRCVTVSIGVATLVPQHGGVSAALIGAADDALYAAKRAGRNRVSVAGA